MFNAFLPSQEKEDGEGTSEEGTGGGVFSFFEMAKEVAANVQKSSTEIVQSVSKTDWGKEFRDFSSAIQQDTQEMVEETKEVVNSADLNPNIKVPKNKQEVQESIEVLGNTIESFGKSIIGGTSELLSQMKETVQQEMQAASIKHKQTQQEMKLKKSGAGKGSEESKKEKRYNEKVSAMQRDSSTYCDEPEDFLYFETWGSHFDLKDYKAQVEETLKGNAFMLELQSRIVPLIVDYETFWTQYFFRLHMIQVGEGMAEKILEKKAVEDEQQLPEEQEEEQQTAAEGPEPALAVETPTALSGKEDEPSSPSGFSPVQGESPRGLTPKNGFHSRTPSGLLSEPDVATASDSSANDWINVKTKHRGSPPQSSPEALQAAKESEKEKEKEKRADEDAAETPREKPGEERDGDEEKAAAQGPEEGEEVAPSSDEEELSPLPSPAPGTALEEDDDIDIDEDWGEM
ncbi:BSD domain-containing protein [Chloropicon primus]|nr:BSD domain-containing protein [Chloropicon primus]